MARQHAQRRLPTRADRHAALSVTFGIVNQKLMLLSMEAQELALQRVVKRLRQKKRRGDPMGNALLDQAQDRIALTLAPKIAMTVHSKLKMESEESKDMELDALLAESTKQLGLTKNGKANGHAVIEVKAEPVTADPVHDDERES